MGMAQRQRQAAIDQVTDDLLKEGLLPDAAEIGKRTDAFFLDKTPGLPYFRPRPVEAYAPSNPAEFNWMFSRLTGDAGLLFHENNYQNNRIVSMFDTYLTEKEKIEASVEKLQLRVDGLMDTLRSGKVRQTQIESFQNFYGIDLAGNRERNIPKTTAFVDLVQRKAYNEKRTRPQDKVNLSKASVVVHPITPVTGNVMLGTPESILKDTVNQTLTWTLQKKTDGECSIEVSIDLTEVVVMSSVLMNLKSTKAVSVHLSVSEDGSVWRDLMDIETTSFAEWNFSRSRIKNLKFKIKKYEPDAEDGSGYEYVYAIMNVSLTNDNFLNKNVLTSKPWMLDKIPNQVTLLASDVVPPNTDIKYYLGVDNGIDKIDWRLVTSGVPIDFGFLRTVRSILTSPMSTSDGLGAVGQLHSETDPTTVDLRLGYQQWHVEEFDVPGEVSSTAGWQPSLACTVYPKIDELFCDSEIYLRSIRAGNMTLCTQYVHCKNDVSLPRRKIIGDVLHSVFVNNRQIQAVNGQYTLGLSTGWNRVQFCLFSTVNKSVTHNFNLLSVSEDLYARPALKQVSLHHLKTNIKENDRSVYALDEEKRILVKYNPSEAGLAQNSNNADGLRFLSVSRYIPGEVLSDYPSGVVKVRLMATLTNIAEDVSPQIINYQIISE